MLLILLMRCDDRLIHGQCMTRVVPSYAIKDIIAIDDITAGNSILKNVFVSAIPPNMTASIYTTADSYEPVKKALEDNSKTLVIFRNPAVYKHLLDNVPDIPKHMNIGPMSSKNNSQEVNTGTYLDAKDIEVVDELVNRGVDVYFQIVPDQKKYSWDEVKKKIK